MANLCIKTPSSAILVLIFQLLVLRPRPSQHLLTVRVEGANPRLPPYGHPDHNRMFLRPHPPLKNTPKVWGCVARRDLGDRSPFKRQTATKFWGFETQVWSICFCICFPTGTEHLSYVAHTVRLPRLGLPWKVSSFHHASKCNTPQFDIEGGRTPSIMWNHPVEGNFVTLCKCFPFPNTAHTHKHFKMDRDCKHPNKSCQK